jgi:hypothetical protein
MIVGVFLLVRLFKDIGLHVVIHHEGGQISFSEILSGFKVLLM